MFIFGPSGEDGKDGSRRQTRGGATGAAPALASTTPDCPSNANPGAEKRFASLTASQNNRKKGKGDPNDDDLPSNMGLLFKRPEALFHLIPRPAFLFGAGAVAGAIGKTLTAPLDRVKLLLQVKGGYSGAQVAAASKSGNVIKALAAIGREEGFMGYWKGNIPQVVRVIPYSAAQLCFYDMFKTLFHKDKDKPLPIPRRLAAGACAGMASTLVTYPLDSLRLRLAVDPNLRGMGAACRTLLAEGGVASFYRGVGTAMIGIAPYLALELAAFDLIPQDKVPAFVRGFCAAFIATSVCYPLDTVRRQMQMQTKGATLPLWQMVQENVQKEGVRSLYRGFVPNALKNLPNKGIRLSVFDVAKKVLQGSEEAYKEEVDAHRKSMGNGRRVCSK